MFFLIEKMFRLFMLLFSSSKKISVNRRSECFLRLFFPCYHLNSLGFVSAQQTVVRNIFDAEVSAGRCFWNYFHPNSALSKLSTCYACYRHAEIGFFFLTINHLAFFKNHFLSCRNYQEHTNKNKIIQSPDTELHASEFTTQSLDDIHSILWLSSSQCF